MRWLLVVCMSTLLLVVFAQMPLLDDELGAEPQTTANPTDVPQVNENTVERNENDNSESEPNEAENIEADSLENGNPEAGNEDSSAVSEEIQTPEVEESSVENVANSTESSLEDAEEHASDENQGNQSGQNNNSEENIGSVPDSNENTENSEEQHDSQGIDISGSVESASNEVVGEPIQTEGGMVQGYYLHGDATTGIRSYYDIPYGSYSLFGVPEKHAEWDDVHQTSEHSIRCPQMDDTGESVVGDLDCLTLSIFAPTDIENASVLFHIHDGDFKSGSGDPLIYGPEYLVPKGIILILPNYRLSALGFLCLRNSIALGNAALKDLTLALEWTKNNIAAFGGNPSKIVLSGIGSAGALAEYLALSPKSRDYVSGVITDSGSILAHWAIDRNPTETADALVESLKQEIDEELDLELLIKAARDIEFKPCIETGTNSFLDRSPWTILNEESINKTFMIGSANHAGLREAMLHTEESLSELNNDFMKFLPNDLKFDDSESEYETEASIKQQYFTDEVVNLDHIKNISLYYTDAYYLSPSIRVARQLVAAGSKVYFYEFSFVGELNRELESLNTLVSGATRGDLVGYVFNQGSEAQPDSAEETMRETLTTLWVTFIQTGSPMGVEWTVLESVAEPEEQWLSIGTEITTKTGLHLDRLSLWTKIYNEHFIERSFAIHFTSNFNFILVMIIIVLFGID